MIKKNVMIYYFSFPKQQPSIVWKGLGKNGQNSNNLDLLRLS